MLSVVVSVVMMFAGAAGLYLAGSQVSTVELDFARMILAVFAYLPAAWIFIAVSVLLLGYAPGLIKLVWVYLGFGFATIYFGGILQLPDWVTRLSPFGYVQRMPVESYKPGIGILMVAVFIGLTLIGAIKYRTRNISSSGNQPCILMKYSFQAMLTRL